MLLGCAIRLPRQSRILWLITPKSKNQFPAPNQILASYFHIILTVLQLPGLRNFLQCRLRRHWNFESEGRGTITAEVTCKHSRSKCQPKHAPKNTNSQTSIAWFFEHSRGDFGSFFSQIEFEKAQLQLIMLPPGSNIMMIRFPAWVSLEVGFSFPKTHSQSRAKTKFTSILKVRALSEPFLPSTKENSHGT